LHKPVAYLNKMIYPGFTIADGTCADPGFEEGGKPVNMNVMLAGSDSVLIDAYAASILGHKAEDIEYIKIAEEAGIGSTDIEGAEIIRVGGEGITANIELPDMELIKSHVNEKEACSACYANLASALFRIDREQGLGGLKVSIGQGFKEQEGETGIGDCTSGFKHCLKGCPPDKFYLYSELKKMGRHE
jgi:hypothetical protein